MTTIEPEWKRRDRERDEKRARAENRKVIALALLIALGLTTALLSVVARFAAPCEYIDWMPVTDLPGRCLPGGSDV